MHVGDTGKLPDVTEVIKCLGRVKAAGGIARGVPQLCPCPFEVAVNRVGVAAKVRSALRLFTLHRNPQPRPARLSGAADSARRSAFRTVSTSAADGLPIAASDHPLAQGCAASAISVGMSLAASGRRATSARVRSLRAVVRGTRHRVTS